MRATHWTSITFLTAIGVLLLFQLPFGEAESSSDPTLPDRGNLAPLLSPLPRLVERVRVVPEMGPVVDLATLHDQMVLLSSKGWLLHSGGVSRGWFGDPTPGSPTWLDHGVSVAVGEGEVSILDARRSSVSVWDTVGNRVREIPIPIEATLAQQPKQLLLGPEGEILALLLKVNLDGSASFDIMALDPLGGARTVATLPKQGETMLFQEPRLAWAPSSLLMMDPLTHSLSSLTLSSGQVTQLPSRVAPPLWSVPRSHVREYEKLLGRMGSTMAGLSQLPPEWPSVRDFSVRPDGSILLAVTATEDRVHIEHLRPDGTPIGRFSLEGFAQPVFLSSGRAFLAEQRIDETVIYEFIF